MDHIVFTRLVRNTLPQQGLQLRFNKETGMVALNLLDSLCINYPSRIRISESDVYVVKTILHNHHWGVDRNRTVGVFGLPYIEDKYLHVLGSGVEHLELITNHGAQGLMASRQKTQNCVAKRIIDEVISFNIIDALTDWCLSIEGRLVFCNTIPCIEFYIMNGSNTFFYCNHSWLEWHHGYQWCNH